MRAEDGSITFSHVIDVLNDALEKDPEAVRALIEQRVPCNDALADHPTIQVQQREDSSGACTVGLLGFLNGIFGVDEDGWGPICAVFEEDGTLTRFEQTKRFKGFA